MLYGGITSLRNSVISVIGVNLLRIYRFIILRSGLEIGKNG